MGTAARTDLCATLACCELAAKIKVRTSESIKAGTDTALRPVPGSYALILSCCKESKIKVGRLGRMRLQRGFYMYVGSALGSGGLHARIAHHQGRSVQPHWHIDYLRRHTGLDQIWWQYGAVRREHEWARAIGALPSASIPLAHFGASDCYCESHLYFFASRPSLRTFEWNLRVFGVQDAASAEVVEEQRGEAQTALIVDPVKAPRSVK